MRRVTPLIRIALSCATFLPAAAASQERIDALRWLAGCWRLVGGTTTVDEQWMSPNGGAMLGVSRTVTNGRVREFEFLRISAAGDTLVYAANPSGQSPTEFRASNVGATEVVFENRAHDFPQRIRYRLATPTVLIATIDGDRDNRRQPVTFSYARTSCDQPAASASASAPGPATAPATAESVRAALQPKYDSLVARELDRMGTINLWFAEQADAGFAHLMWTAGGATVPVARSDVLAGAGERMRTANIGAQFRNRKFTISLEKVLLRGDTADVLVSSFQSYAFADTAGRYGARGADAERTGTERRIDRWVRAGADWRLRSVSIIGLEILMNGKLVTKDGKAVPQ